MKKETKKIIAKEVLIVFGFVLFIPIFCGGFYLKNLYFETRTESLKEEVELIDPYKTSIGEKLLFRFEYAEKWKNDFKEIYGLNKYDFSKIDLIIKQRAFEQSESVRVLDELPDLDEKEISLEEIEEELESKKKFNPDSNFTKIPNKASLKRKKEKYNNQAFHSLPDGAIKLLFSKKEIITVNLIISEYLNKKQEWKRTSYKVTPYRKMTSYLIWWLIILSSIAYPLRGLYFLLKWAIKTVKS